MIGSRRAEVAAASALVGLGVTVVALARRLPYWHEFAPGPGFFPLWLGLLLTATAALELSLVLRNPDPPATSTPSDGYFTRHSALLGALAVIGALLVVPLGFVLATAVFVAAASWVLAPRDHATNAVASVVIPLGVWLIFEFWLGVPLPRGPFGF